jgi:cytochrome P450
VYGPDADEFRPERWLEAAADGGKRFKEESFMAFGLGSRTCIGKNISLLEINKVIPLVVRDYDFEFIAKDGSLETSKYLAGRNRWFVKPAHLHARVLRRNNTT